MEQGTVGAEKQMDEAVRAGDFEALKAAIENGGNVNGRYKGTNKPYLLVVFGSVNPENPAWGSVKCCQNRLKMARLLLSHGADPNARDKDADMTPLYWACKWQNYDVVKQLIDRGAKANLIKNGRHDLHNDYNPLIMAAQKRKPEIVRLLLEAGADVNITNKNGFTPLNLACARGHPAIVRLLIEAGADVNVRGMGEWSPLHWACYHGHTDLTRLLLDHGADPGARNKGGSTPLDWAMTLRPHDPAREEIIELFRECAPELVMEKFCTVSIAPGPA